MAFELRDMEDEMLTMNERNAKVLGLSNEELRRYGRLFNIFDRDSDGCIDHEELMLLLVSLGIPATKDTAVTMIASRDKDGSGKLEYQEFIEIMIQQNDDDSVWGNIIERIDTGKALLSPDFMKRSDDARLHVKAALSSNRMRPDSKIRCTLDFLIASACCYFYVIVLLEDADKEKREMGSWRIVCECIASLVFVCDILFQLNTSVTLRSGAVITDRLKILQHYSSCGSMYVDIASALPWDLPFYGLSREVAIVLRHLRILKVIRISSLFYVENNGLMSPTFVTFYFRLVPLFMNIVRMIVVLHSFSILWIIFKGPDYEYVDALYYILYTLTTVGYGDIEVYGSGEKLYACFLFILATCLNGLTVGYLTAFIMRSDINGDKVDKMRQTLAVLKHFEVPHTLQEEILSYQYHVLQHNLGVAYTDVIAGLPPAMQEQVSLYMRVRLVTQVPMFHVCEIKIQISLAQSLKNVVVPPDEYIMLAGEEGHEMFFLSHGFCDVLTPDGKLLATITKGGFFGEVALLVETHRHTNVKALTFCDLFILQRTEFLLILDKYPSFATHIHTEIEKAGDADEPNTETDALRIIEEMEGGQPRMRAKSVVDALGAISGACASPPAQGQHRNSVTSALKCSDKDNSESASGGSFSKGDDKTKKSSATAVLSVLHKLQTKAKRVKKNLNASPRAEISVSPRCASPRVSPRGDRLENLSDALESDPSFGFPHVQSMRASERMAKIKRGNFVQADEIIRGDSAVDDLSVSDVDSNRVLAIPERSKSSSAPRTERDEKGLLALPSNPYQHSTYSKLRKVRRGVFSPNTVAPHTEDMKPQFNALQDAVARLTLTVEGLQVCLF